jgi:hypothetical protein
LRSLKLPRADILSATRLKSIALILQFATSNKSARRVLGTFARPRSNAFFDIIKSNVMATLEAQ